MSATTSQLATIKVPARLAALFEGDELPRWALESILVEANRQHKVSSGFLREVLGLEIGEADALLAAHGIFYEITSEELNRQVDAVPTPRAQVGQAA